MHPVSETLPLIPHLEANYATGSITTATFEPGKCSYSRSSSSDFPFPKTLPIHKLSKASKVIERSRARLLAGALPGSLGQLSLPSLRGR